MPDLNQNPEWIYLIAALIFILSYALYSSYSQWRHRKGFDKNMQEGLGEPASLHPVFEEQKCLGCKACITACPEGNVIGVINNKARLINPSHCIGHGACKKACPFDAIILVFAQSSDCGRYNRELS